jgi:hypothetical protein
MYPILLRKHPSLCERELYYHGFNNIIIRQDSWHKTENNTQSLTWHIGKACTFMHLFRSTRNFLIHDLYTYRPSCWAHGRSMPPRSDQVILARVNKRKKNKENSRTVTQACCNFCFIFYRIPSKHVAASASSTSLQCYTDHTTQLILVAHLLSPDYSVYYTQ